MSTLSGNLGAFLDMIAWSEGTTQVAGSDDGYNVLVGGTLFSSYADHPRQLVNLGHGLVSTAAGRYQLLERYYDAYKASLGLPDFGKDSQDAIAMQQIKECHAIDNITNGAIAAAIAQCAHIWASLPGANYAGQHMHSVSDLEVAFANAGGSIADGDTLTLDGNPVA